MIDSRARNVSICGCLDHGPILTQHITVNASRTPLRVSEAVQESSARTAKSYPDTPIALPRGGRITPIIYVSGDWAESDRDSERWLRRCCRSAKLVHPRKQTDWVAENLLQIRPWHDVQRADNHLLKSLFPLRKIVALLQGIVLFKEKTLYFWLSCN